jgi:hypothetical protein
LVIGRRHRRTGPVGVRRQTRGNADGPL